MRMNSRIKILIVIGLILVAMSISTAVRIPKIFGESHETGFNRMGIIIWIAKRLLYIWLSASYGTEGLNELKANLSEIVMMNPSITTLSNLMVIVIKLVFALYIPAIAFLGFYILFLSSSPEGRAEAKSMLTKLIVGLIFVSVSPQLMNLLLTVSEGLTSSILAPTAKGVFTKAWDTSIGATPLDLRLELSGLKGLHFIATFIEIELGFYTFLFFMILVWGAFIFPILIRFFAVSVFIVLFPLSILLYSFEFTKALGRTMLEQTIIWTFLQVINALIVLTVVQSIISLGEDFMKVGWGITIPVIPLVGCLMFAVAPLFIIRFFRGFLP
ncbi:MAG: hypothetical protein DRO76_02470 [Candidatus Altiarchaeales archaeon]|nr:MAG: hypothetical protein DRO76_02470 [Candidatus Altiarchaeales archaeon]